MENGNPVNINLESSGLDTSSSDMLVNIQQPTFQHNWQKYQGKFMPNSMRMEKNGWAAGWNVYNFVYNTYRKKLADNLYAQIVKLNSNVYALYLYNSEKSYNALAQYIFVAKDAIISGEGTLANNKLSGKLNSKPFTIDLNNFSITPGFSLTHETLQSHYEMLRIVDDTTAINFDLTLYKVSNLTGDFIDEIKFKSLQDGVYTWGGYTYDVKSNVLTTPDGVELSPNVSDVNLLTFTYNTYIDDEAATITYSLVDYVGAFEGIECADATQDSMLIGATPATLPFNHYSGKVVPDKILPGGSGVTVDWQLPLWLTFGCTVDSEDSSAIWCNNTSNFEIGVKDVTGTVTLRCRNVFDKSVKTVTVSKPDQWPCAYIFGLSYRFNQIYKRNELTRLSIWQPYKYKLRETAYYKHANRYANFANFNIGLFKKVFGNIYTYGGVTVNLSNLFEYNNPYDWSNISNCVYTMVDISGIPTFKRKGAANTTTAVNDETFIANNIGFTVKNIAVLNAQVSEYSPTDVAKSYSSLYDATGTYIGGLYETVSILDTDTALWPFNKVPKFNLSINGGTVVGCYYTDGTNYITDFEAFKSFVLGTVTAKSGNPYIETRSDYSRTRGVTTYSAAYDFEYKRASDFDTSDAYDAWVSKFNTTWKKYYPNVESPLDYFSDSATDDTFLNFTDIETTKLTGVDVEYVAPGVYVHNNYAVPFDTSTGLIVYPASSKVATPFIYHHTVDKLSKYDYKIEDVPGVLSFDDGQYAELPKYYGASGTQTLVSGKNPVQKGLFGNISYLESFEVVSTTADLTGGSLEFGFRTTWEYSYKFNWSKRKIERKQTISYDTSSIDKSGGSDLWLSNALFEYSNGKLTQKKLSLFAKQWPSSSVYKYLSPSGSFIIALPIVAHSATKFVYPEMLTTTQLQTAKNAVKVSKVASADVDQSIVYFDRNDIDKSIGLFNVGLVDSVTAGDSIQKGSAILKLTNMSTSISGLWYAKKKTTISGNSSQEVFSAIYIPGVAYGDKANTTGNLTFISASYPQIKLTWTPVIYTMPVTADIKYLINNSKNLQHKYFTNDYLSLQFSATLGSFDANRLRLPMTVTVNSATFSAYFDVDTQTTVFNDSGKTVYNASGETVKVTGIEGTGDTASIQLGVNLNFGTLKARIFKTNDPLVVLKSADTYNIVFSKDDIDFTYDYVKGSIVYPEVDTRIVKNTLGAVLHVEYSGNVGTYVISISELTNNKYTFTYIDKPYTLDIAEFENAKAYIDVTSCDVRQPNKTEVIGRIDSDNEYQIIRQQWNSTIEVENFWWVDATHVLELNSYDFVLKRKLDSLDDWNGDKFEKVWTYNRSDILSTSVQKYFVTNVYKSSTSAFFVTLQLIDGNIRVALYDVRNKFKLFATFNLKVQTHALGTKLNETVFSGNLAYLNTYNTSLLPEYILSKAAFSNTVVDGKLLLGVHFSNNFDQWTVVFDLKTKQITHCIQGYGFVGLHGDLTGGEIPSDYFDVDKGFNGTVEPLSVLDIIKRSDKDDLNVATEVNSLTDLYKLDTRVVGTYTQQFYISTSLYGVVSHLTYKNGRFVKQILPISNNLSTSFKSPSFGVSMFTDTLPQATRFVDLLNIDANWAIRTVWEVAAALIGEPMIYSLAPRYCSFMYINMTIGQYAYVHYNSSWDPDNLEKVVSDDTRDGSIGKAKTKGNVIGKKNIQADPILSSDYSFDKKRVSQKVSVELNTAQQLLGSLLLAAGTALDTFAHERASVNEAVNSTSTSDFGTLFQEHAILNIEDMISTRITSRSRAGNSITGTVTSLKTLDMFYSTCDKQNIFAGPGFVEHRFVAQCVAQSSTVLRVSGSVYQIYYVLKALTILQQKIQDMMVQAFADYFKNNGNASGLMATCGTFFGTAISIAYYTTAFMYEKMVKVRAVAMDVVMALIDEIAKEGLTATLDGNVAHEDLNVEGKHKYGEKNETFMWPCWGVTPGALKYTDESVEAAIKNTPWYLSLKSRMYWDTVNFSALSLIPLQIDNPDMSDSSVNLVDMFKVNIGQKADPHKMDNVGYNILATTLTGSVPYYQGACYGKTVERTLPDDMAKIEGVSSFLPQHIFKNENISCSVPAFTPSAFQDYKIDEAWELGMCCTYGGVLWLCVKDTKITNCEASNMFITEDFCGIATSYTAIEVKRGLSKAYMRPYAITPNTLAMNCTGYNSILDNKLYHAFDGVSYRLIDWVGTPALNINRQTYFYSFQRNDNFKRSNIIAPEEFLGNFTGEPSQALDTIDDTFTLTTIASKQIGMEGGTIGEDKDAVRYSIPVLTEAVTTLPAAVKTLTAMPLLVSDGVTTLTTILANNQTAYKAPLSVDFMIGKNAYRQTEEYICSIHTQHAIDIVEDIVPSLGLIYIGSTPTEAYFYSKATRCYYIFTGSNLVKADMLERFRDVQKGYWDFVEQVVVMPCLMTYKRLNPDVEDKDSETDNIIVPILYNNSFGGELPPPLTTIFNDDSWYKCYSLPCGFAYQGPNRVIINRSVFVEYMLETMKDNLGKWKKLDREHYTFNRGYPEKFETVTKDISKGVDGWTHNPFLLVTSALGTSESADNLFEWVITFCWPVEMDLIYKVDDYAVVNIMAETMSPGGKLQSRPTHVFLTKELFTRNGNYGYYSFRYQSKNGTGNRERLKIWSDQYIAISSIVCESKPVTTRRTEILTQQVDVKELHEL